MTNLLGILGVFFQFELPTKECQETKLCDHGVKKAVLLELKQNPFCLPPSLSHGTESCEDTLTQREKNLPCEQDLQGILSPNETQDHILRAGETHNRFVADTKDKEPDVLFVGDSLVQLLHQFEIWRQLFSPLHALNFGIGGDATQHVLWRLQNGELENIRPKVIVLWVGTNNHNHTAEQVAGGIETIVNLLNQWQPQAKVIVLGLLPRGKDPNPLRVKNALVNELVRGTVPNLNNTSFLDVDPGFVNSDGTISHNDMYDYLHLTRHAYTSVCKLIHARVHQLLGESACDPL
ncbi:platelet-activating factor acetylhydrolase IB subunit alpha1-like [Heterodontus francisci]|uniref:platelet-activating factor acetylhydrolase IB subunit alpha1-like n=1 Tax=Heterodontus francisci TaxID=7792 RepID=UPI00355AE10C